MQIVKKKHMKWEFGCFFIVSFLRNWDQDEVQGQIQRILHVTTLMYSDGKK